MDGSEKCPEWDDMFVGECVSEWSMRSKDVTIQSVTEIEQESLISGTRWETLDAGKKSPTFARYRAEKK